ncbi:helix-turn-helix domain-containing protein [Oleisolibacter albus]|uniref:helix-turn-helix domain-containing protein n=1 Tax=Oleisolibacter albus TaxID=2171757 RepID=UPI0013902808|nr:helix-turn-helix transcriptional regulator [Oleisolibacter albus]
MQEQDGPRLRALREERGLSLARLAAAAGMSKGELSKLENGVRPLRPDHVLRLGRAMGLNPEALLAPGSPLLALMLPQRAERTSLPLYDGRDLTRAGSAAEAIGIVPAPEQLRGDPDAYAIVINDLSNAPALMPGVVLHVSPAGVPRVGDLVINRVSWTPLAFYLRQDDDGQLYGLTLSRRRVTLDLEDVEKLHRVAGVWFMG